ncbi:beta/gamma crystallin domain-containing protein 3 isoform X1 [Pimephales promelas]|uniref:beta/gamma crystallin domain-containing protein 3 isoform X1 n=1 Tax=Pimephales promelas TaxID=90988 RepID=UPI0019555C72|nr:beta/gamma crystallin domain-containing protein 3 isoform X1 [Pimephales promelas]
MSDVKTQMSWHEDFAKNLSRFFSRSKSVDTEGNESEIREADDGSADQTPEQHQNTQESPLSDGSSASHSEDESSTPQSASTAPPADGFFRRLGSLFQFSRAEPARGQRETQIDTDSLITEERETQTSANTNKSGGRGEPVKPSVCHSELTHTQSQEQTEEDRSDGVNINAKERSEEKRRHDLACPPVVTYGTYRGLREVRKPKKKHRVELQSPISEGEEATPPDNHEDNEISSSSVNTMSSDSQEYQASPSQTQQIEDGLTQSDLLDEVPTVESGLTPAHQLPHVTDSDRLLTCIDVYRIPQPAEPSPSNDPVNRRQEHLAQAVTLEAVSGDVVDLTPSNAQSITVHHDTLPTPEQSSEQPKPSVIVNRTDDLAPVSQAHQRPEESKLERAEVDSGVDEEVLRLESKKMVDSILTNALAALQKMEASETEHGVLLTCELHEGPEAVLFEGLEGRGDGGTEAEHQFRVMLSDQTLSVVLEEELAGTCRSAPSSGYESIAGSDTDIRGIVGLNSELTTTTCAPVGSQNENRTILECLVKSSAADDEPLSQNLQSHRDVVHKTDLKLFLPALTEESLSREQHPGDVSACADKGGKRPQDAAKDSAMSNNTSIITPASAEHQDSLQQSQTLSVTLNERCSHSLASDTADSDMMSEIKEQPPAIRSQECEATEAPHSGSSQQEPISCDFSAGTDCGVQPCVTEVQCSGGLHHPSHWVSVLAIRCDVTDDQSLSPATLEEHLKPELSVSPGLPTVSVSGQRIHLDPTDSSSRTAAVAPHHSRFHDLDLHQVDGGFAIISEEEESDMVFVNDTGPMHSPSARRAKAYPFSLSPIYEEECVREEAVGRETLPFPPVAEEEQRSVEQPASSVLSLLQSVSEKLQSSVICSPAEDSSSASPTSYRYSRGDDSEEDDEDSSNLLRRQLTGAEPEPNAGQEHSSETDRTANGAPEGVQEQQDWGGTLGDIGNNANTPFCQYLNSRLMASGEEEPQDIKGIVFRRGCNAMVREENRGFGKVNPRPTPMLIYEGQSLSAERREICGDVEDAGKDLFAHGATLHALRGCWLLYVDSWYRGSCVVLEEGQTVKTSRADPDPSAVLTVGSLRTLKDDGVPEIHLYPRAPQPIRVFSATDLPERDGPVLLSDLCVRTGCWLVFDQPGFSGSSAVLEADGRITPVLQDSLLSRVKSLRPVEPAGLRVTRPLDPKVMLFEKPQFQGQCWELLDHTPRLRDIEGPAAASSLRVTGGVWVCFSSEGFRGHQCVLEEGEYSDCTRLFGGTELTIQSLRFIQTDFLEPAVCVTSCGEETEVCVDLPDLQESDSISVKSGAWVAYSGRCFTGHQYVLEKGQYPGQLQWGDGQSSAQSLRAIHREVAWIEEPQFLLRAYSQTRYSGESREFESDCGVTGLASFRVIRGNWLLFDEEGFSGNQYILGEGLYPDLTSCGCLSSAIKSLKPIPYSFTEPSASLFSLSGFEGLEETCFSDVESMSHFFSQSVRVTSGLWVAYEYARFKGRQTLLQPGEYPAWGARSGWETIGSLKPLKQPKVLLHVRSRALAAVLTSESRDGSFPAKLSLCPADRSLDTQRWTFTGGLLKNTALRGCLCVIGAKACAGARVALWEEHGRVNQRWSLSEDGRICSHLNHSLVLDLRGGCGADRDQLVLSPLGAADTQRWDLDVL